MMDLLPENALIQVFSLLDITDLCLSARKVCTRWHAVSFASSLWTKVDLSRYHRHISTQDYLNFMQSVSDHVVHLSVKDCCQLSDCAFSSKIFHCKKLKELDLRGVDLSRDTWACILSKHPDIEIISYDCNSDIIVDCCSLLGLCSLRQLKLDVTYNDMDSLKQVLVLNTNLEELSVTGSEHVDDALLEMISSTVPDITGLELTDCVLVSDDAFLSCAERFKSLQEVNISGTYLGDQSLLAIGKVCGKNLRCLDISACRRITDIGIISLAESCASLAKFIVNGPSYHMSTNSNITDVGLRAIALNCSSLQRIDLIMCPSISGAGLLDVVLKCPILRHLNISGCLQIRNGDMIEVANVDNELESLIANGCLQLTGHGVSRILRKCHKLQHLSLETCFSLCDFNLAVMGSYGTRKASLSGFGNAEIISQNEHECLSKLADCRILGGSNQMKHLDLRLCSKLSVESLRQITAFCQHVKLLDLAGCYEIDDQGISFIAKTLYRLEYLDISSISGVVPSGITDLSLLAIAKHCRQLQTLYASHVRLVTFDGIKAVLTSCPKLIQFAGCPSEECWEKTQSCLLDTRGCYYLNCRVFRCGERRPPSCIQPTSVVSFPALCRLKLWTFE